MYCSDPLLNLYERYPEDVRYTAYIKPQYAAENKDKVYFAVPDNDGSSIFLWADEQSDGEMKKYNSFKLFYVNDDFVVEGDPITLTKEGDYLVGPLQHLSLYALAGDITTVPKTGDNIIAYISLGIISILGLSISILLLKKKQFN